MADARPMLRHAFDQHDVMPSVDVCDLEMERGVIDAAETLRAPVMLQAYPGDLDHASPSVMIAMIRALAEEASVPGKLYLDHGDSLERAATWSQRTSEAADHYAVNASTREGVAAVARPATPVAARSQCRPR